MNGKRTISSRTLYVLSLVVAALFLSNIYYHLHIAPGWQWGPALDKMPKHMITNYMAEVYDNGKGGYAAGEYLDAKVVMDKALFPELADGEPIKHTIRQVFGDGRSIVVIHDIEAARGATAKTVIDVFEIGARGGRVQSVTRYEAQVQG